MSVSALCIGHASYDLSMIVDSYPAENSKCETEELIEAGGGPAANAAWVLARWGVPTALAALVGDDSYGKRLREELKATSIDCRLVQSLPQHSTPVSFILVNRSDGSRTIINRKSTSKNLQLEVGDFAGFAPDLLLFDGHELEASLAALKAFPSAVTILDAGSLREGTKVLAEKVQYLVCSERFAVQFTGRTDLSADWGAALDPLRKANRGVVVITLGEHGCVYQDGSRSGHIPALKVSAQDTTAAGDIFHGAFAFGILQNMPLPGALRLATVAAGMSVQHLGGRGATPELAAVRGYLSHER